MDVSKLFHILDVITGEELKDLQTEHVTFLSLEMCGDHNRFFSRNVWSVTNDDNEKIEISFTIELHLFFDDFLVFETDLFTFARKMPITFSSKFTEQIEHIVIYLEEKREKIEQSLKNNKTIRFLQMMGSLRFESYNHTLKKFEEAKKIRK